MGDLLVSAGTIVDGTIDTLTVELHKLDTRIVSREQVIAWMRDGHSLIPYLDGKRQTALQLVTIEGDEPSCFVRTDNTATSEDSLPALPAS
jgi:hypothetical protein